MTKFHIFSVLCLAILLPISLPATADIQIITDGESLAISCQQALIAVDKGPDLVEPDVQNNAFICFSYLSGIIGAAGYSDTLAELCFALATAEVKDKGNLQKFRNYCIDWNIQYQKAARIVLDFARQNPEQLGEPAYSMALRALQNAYPCHERKKAYNK